MLHLLNPFRVIRSDHASPIALFVRRWTPALVIAAAVAVGALAAVAGDVPDRDGDGLSDAAEIRLGTYAKNVADSDGDGVSDSSEDANGNGIVDPLETDPARTDTDGDGLGDGLEWGASAIDVDGDGFHNGRDLDSDGDGITDADELGGNYYPRYASKQTNPYLADSDGDGLFDREEATWGTDPAAPNSDGDGLTNDGQEVTFGANPHANDTDGDGLPDGVGVDGLDQDLDSDGFKNALDWDSDNDGLRDGDEDLNDNGVADAGETDAARFDTDGDGWPDGYEFHRRFAPFNMNPVVSDGDTDGDGLPNGIEVSRWKTLPNNPDSDGDGIRDDREGPGGIGYTTVNDGGVPVPSGTPGGIKLPIDSDLDGLPNPLDTDSDNDGLPDASEDTDANGVMDAGETGAYDADSDDDGLSDGAELRVFATNPRLADTDGDGLTDGDEVKTTAGARTDPRVRDTDGDGRDDGLENESRVVNGTTDPDGDGVPPVLDRDSDNDGILDAIEDANGNGVVDGGETNPLLADTDGDGIWDGLEDRDRDGAIDAGETNPRSADSDNDGLTDFAERFTLTWNGIAIATDPTRADTDLDGVSDGVEVNTWQSNPINRDTDGDGMLDGATITIRWKNSFGAEQTTTYQEDNTQSEVPGNQDGRSNVRDANSDWNDLVSGDHDFRDATEYAYRNKPGVLGPLHPGRVDTDADGVADADEVLGGSDPLDAGSFTASGPSWAGQDPDSDGLYNPEETILLLLTNNVDSDGDGLNDGEELDPLGVDYQHDGTPGGAPDNVDLVAQIWPTDPNDADTDNDGLNDHDELVGGGTPVTDPLIADSDGDKVEDDQEQAPSLENPRLADTDGDRLLDGEEDANRDGLWAPPETRADLGDSDGDDNGSGLMNDARELYLWTTDPLASADKDSDTLPDDDEVFTAVFGGRTDPRWNDSDVDGLADGGVVSEVASTTNPLVRDTDADYLPDGYEVLTTHPGYPNLANATLPSNADSDGDALRDCAELALGTDPIDATTDGDGIADGIEAPGAGTDREALAFQTAGSYLANPDNADSDGDGIDEGVAAPLEVLGDNDGDGGSNAMDVDADNDWIRDGTLAADPDLSETYTAHVDADGIPNALDGDSFDNDRLSDPVEFFLFDPGLAMNDTDRDDDGLLDGSEYWHHFFHPTALTLGGGLGVDNDEIRVRSNPMELDTDGDQLLDGLEVGLTAAQVPTGPLSPGVGTTIAGLARYEADPPEVGSFTPASNSSVGRWDSDADGLADGIEDADQDGQDADHTPLAGAIQTHPSRQDSDGDGLFDGTENKKVTGGDRSGNPAYNPASGDLSDALDLTTDADLLNDGLEAGPDVAFVPGRTPRPYFTKVLVPDTDDDGLSDSQEDANLDGVRQLAETDANLCDTDNDQSNDDDDSLPLNPLAGGATWSLTTSRPVNVTADPPTTPNQFFTKTWPIVATNSSLKDLASFYVVATTFTWTADFGGYVTPPGYAHPPISADHISIQLPGGVSPLPGLDNCFLLTQSAGHSYEFALQNIPASTPPGSYEGTIYFVASGLSCPSTQLPCPAHSTPGPGTAVSTVTRYDSMRVTINIPPHYDLDVLNIDSTQPSFGVGLSNPAEFYSGGAVANEMHLKGLAKHDGDLTGVFQVSVPNGDASNGQPVHPSPKWDPDAPSNARLNFVKFKFVPTSIPAYPGSAISFAPGSRTDFDLGTEQSFVIAVNTNGEGACGSAGRYEGTVVTWHDVNNDGVQDPGEDSDQFTLRIELVTPDLDILDSQGSLAANRLEANVNPAGSLPQWTIRAANPSTSTNYDAFDGPGCETFDTPSVFDPRLPVSEAPIRINMPVGVTPDPGTTATFTVVKYDPALQTYDPTKSFRVMVWSEQSGTISKDASQEFKLAVDPTSLTSNPPQGVYTPYYAAGHGDNQYALMTARGTASGRARTARGYPVTYPGSGTTSPEYGLFDRFQVFLTYQPGCEITIGAPTPAPLVLNPGEGGTVTALVTNALCNVTGLGLSRTALTRTGGTEVISDVTLSIDQNTLNPAETTTARVVVNPADCQLDGEYTCTVTVTGNSGSGSVTSSFLVTVNVRTKQVTAPTPTAVGNNPGESVQWTVSVTNGGTAPIKVGELSASLPTLNGPGDPISGLTIDPNPATVSIAPNGIHTFTVNATSAANQVDGAYTGNIAWVVCNRPAVNQLLTYNVNPVLCAPTLAAFVPGTVDPSRCVVLAAQFTNGECAMRDITVSNSPLTGPGGVIPVTLDIDKNSLVAGEQVNVRLSACPPACLLDGTYTSTLTVTGNTDFGPRTVSRLITVVVTSKTLTAAPVAEITANPGVSVQWTVTVTNSGTGPIEVGELQASLPTLSGPGTPISGLSISPNPATVSIAPGGNRAFNVNAVSAVDQAAGAYTGSIAWAVCNRPAADHLLTLNVNPLPCAPALAAFSPATVDPGRCVVLTTELTNGECAMRDITVSSSPLTGAGGVISVTLDIDKNSLVAGEKTNVRLSACPAACLLEGSYTTTLTITGNTDFGPQSVSRPVTVTVTSKTLAAAAVGVVTSNPGLAVQWTATVTNNGTAPVEVGELRVTLPALSRTTAGESDVIAGLSITPDPTTVSIPANGNRTFQVSATLGGDQRDGRYRGSLTWVVCTRPAVLQELTADVNAVPVWSYSPVPADLTCGFPLTVTVTNQGNSQLVLTTTTPSGPAVTVTPNPLVVPYRGQAQMTLNVPCAGLTAGVKNGQIECRDGTAGPTQRLAVNTTVAEVPLLAVGTVPVPEGAPGGIVTFKVPIQNTGNVRLASVKIQEARNFEPARLGAAVRFPDLPIPAVDRSLEIGARDTIAISVDVGSGYFADTYSSRITLRAASVDAVTLVSIDLSFVLNGTADRRVAFSNNPVRFSQARDVTIALAASGKPASIKIYNAVGVLVRTLAEGQTLTGGATTWDFKNDNGVLVASGVYVVVVEVDGTRNKEKLLFIK